MNTEDDDDNELHQAGAIAGGRCKPLSFYWRALNEDWIDALGLPEAPTRKHAKARASILVDAYRNARINPEQFISYSRRKAFYVGQSRYQGDAFTYSTVPWAVDNLTSIGLLDHDRAPPGRLGLQSAFRASPALIQAVQVPLVAFALQPMETIRLKDSDKRLTDYRDTAVTEKARRNVEEINEALRGAHIQIPTGTPVGEPRAFSGESDQRAVAYLLRKQGGGEVTVDLGRNQFYRVFNERLTWGGRFYGHGLQSAPKEHRAAALMDGEPVAEPDYPAHHARLLYGKVGKAMPPNPFEIGGWERAAVKRAFYVMVNADNSAAAQHVIAREIVKGTAAYMKAAELMVLIRRKHAAVADWFCTGAGRWLMRADSDIAENVMLSGLQDGIVTVGIHDSFLAKARYADRVRELMDDALMQGLRRLNPDAPRPEKLPTLLLVLPEGLQLDLFPSQPVSVNVTELDGWKHGPMPDGVRKAFRHEYKRRGLTQQQAADAIGISRPQLANVENGRFGLSAPVADKVKAFVREAAA